MRILLDGPFVQNFNPDAAIYKWYNSSLRARRPTKNKEIESLLDNNDIITQ